MIKLIISMSLLFNIVFVSAQTTNYYTVTKKMNGQDFVYQCDVKGNFVLLYNINNKWTYIDQMKKGTNTPFNVTPENYVPLIVNDKNSVYNDSIVKVIVNEALINYKEKLKGEEFIIITCTNSDTGKIDEVHFEFINFTPYAFVPVSVYREIEMKMVGLKYTLTPLAKTLNYIYQWRMLGPE